MSIDAVLSPPVPRANSNGSTVLRLGFDPLTWSLRLPSRLGQTPSKTSPTVAPAVCNAPPVCRPMRTSEASVSFSFNACWIVAAASTAAAVVWNAAKRPDGGSRVKSLPLRSQSQIRLLMQNRDTHPWG